MAELLNLKLFQKIPIQRAKSQPKTVTPHNHTFITETRNLKTPFSRPTTPKNRPKSPITRIVIPDVLDPIKRQFMQARQKLDTFPTLIVEKCALATGKTISGDTPIGSFLLQRRARRGGVKIVAKQKKEDMIEDQKGGMEPTILTEQMVGFQDEILGLVRKGQKNFRRRM
ncbi:hypothetical protein SS50377_26114 [Spironucleus salmonicida]|uniref:Uncharacterized protein n=1 Tax=Spironucleus salmonicida TaxID=348837 RepID=V6LNZ3_9EUKA|nr:hypothetical protein SS50377_26114 [Spironucleus salmonicida]|eukprot:EST46320.1 Hypothetical protein SS50377_13631 [Spironucleus salmonicida]